MVDPTIHVPLFTDAEGGGGSAGESLNENNKNPQLRTSNKHVINQKKWLSYCIS
jgi:hypothetical protein